MAQSPTIWLLSAYRSASHAAWADWLTDTFQTINWCKLELPGRHFRWRIRGNPLSWLHQLPQASPDLILATSMVDLATLKGLHPRLARVPCFYYFHENQFAYPTSDQQHDSVDPQMVQLYGALAADKCLFNSVYNRDSFLTGVDQLLKKLPDEVPENIHALLRKKSQLLPVPINPVPGNPVPIKPVPINPLSVDSPAIKPVTMNMGTSTTEKNPRLILWNHRWEYDKAPQVFADALSLLHTQGKNFQLILLGERSLKKPAALAQIEQQMAEKIFINNKVTKTDYLHFLSQADIVISTAIHEFQGLSILEAVSAGATPLVPDDLCYTEQYAADYRYPAGNVAALAEILSHWLTDSPPAAPDVSSWYSENLVDQWYKTLTQLNSV